MERFETSGSERPWSWTEHLDWRAVSQNQIADVRIFKRAYRNALVRLSDSDAYRKRYTLQISLKFVQQHSTERASRTRGGESARKVER